MNVNLRIGWYRKDQYELLLQNSVDREELSSTYNQWHNNIEKEFKKLEEQGFAPKKIPVDVLDMIRWCQVQGRVMNGESRSEYITRITHKLYG